MAKNAFPGADRAGPNGPGISEHTRRMAAIAMVLLLAVALPFLVSDYRTFQLTLMISYAIALLGLNILTGYNGQISLGHGAFFAVGAYVAAVMMDRWNLPYWSTLPAAGSVCFVVGFLFGLPALRLEGLYLALATFALAVVTPQILKYKGIEDWTGGVQGIAITKPQAPWHLPLSSDQWLYFVALAVAVVMFVVGARLVRGRVGRALIAIRDNPTAAATMGVDTALYKTMTFGVSALFTGVAGALSAIAVQFVAPDSFGFLLSISFLVGIVIGGFASISGAIYGAFFIEFVPNIADSISKSAPWAVYGAFLVASVYFMPSGIAGGRVNPLCAFSRAREGGPLGQRFRSGGAGSELSGRQQHDPIETAGRGGSRVNPLCAVFSRARGRGSVACVRSGISGWVIEPR